MKLLSETYVRQIESHLANLLERHFCASELTSINQVIRRYVLAGGKRLRPQLCLWTYLNLRPKRSHALPKAVLDLAVAWELFHAFLLAHDDIIDGADRRRDQASLHRQLQLLDHNCPRFGMNLGLIAGDLLYSAAIRTWHEVDLPPGRFREVLRLISRIASTTGFGQAMDIVQSHVPLDDVCEMALLREYHWKTAAYTFEGPMLSGAIAAGAGRKTCRAISDFSLGLGQAYQLQNDLQDLATPAHMGCDLMQAKRTVTLIRARAAMSGPSRHRFDRQLGSLAPTRAGLKSCQSLQDQLRAGQGAQRTRELIQSCLATARNASVAPALPVSLRTAMRRLLCTFEQRYFVPVNGLI